MRHVQSFFAWGFLVEARLAAEGRFHLADQLQPLLAGPGGTGLPKRQRRAGAARRGCGRLRPTDNMYKSCRSAFWFSCVETYRHHIKANALYWKGLIFMVSALYWSFRRLTHKILR